MAIELLFITGFLGGVFIGSCIGLQIIKNDIEIIT